MTPPRQSVRRAAPQLLVLAALFSAAAAAIHAAVAGPHFDEYAPFGLLFLAAAIGQAVWAVFLVTAPSTRALAAGAAGNAGVLAVWVLSRTSGLPIGSESWTPEPIGALDLAASAFESGIVMVAVVLLAAGTAVDAPSGRQVKRFAATGTAVIMAVTGAAFAVEPRGESHHAAATRQLAEPSPQHGAAATGGAASATTAQPARRRTAAAPPDHAHPTPHAK